MGSCDIDVMILDTKKWKSDAEPLIPADTPFLLTTNTAAGASDSSSKADLQVNTLGNELYFNRPEVLKAYREQLIIQTPEYTNISDIPVVGGRFRVRNSEEETVDTSDAAYEKRHRKYETFEKRLRLREKEKLKHEHYKLKERIEQLRAMDGSAFLALPASSFTPIPGFSPNDGDDGIGNIPGTHINGAAAHNEGERRRKEMLDIASSLDERYRVLLPPDRVRKPVEHTPVDITEYPSHGGRGQRHEDEDIELDGPAMMTISVQKEVEKLKFKLPARSSTSTPSAPSPKLTSTKKPRLSAPPHKQPATLPKEREAPSASLTPPPPTPEVPIEPRLSLPSVVVEQGPELPASLTPPPPNEPQVATSPVPSNHETHSGDDMDISSPETVETPKEASTEAPKEAAKEASIDAAEEALKEVAEEAPKDEEAATPAADEEELTSRPTKRIKISEPPKSPHSRVSLPPSQSISVASRGLSRGRSTHPQGYNKKPTGVPYESASGEKEYTTSLLMIAAIRSSAGTLHRNARHHKAFGVKVPNSITDAQDFLLPDWALPYDDEDESDEDEEKDGPLGSDRPTESIDGREHSPETGIEGENPPSKINVDS